jgi:hypothetical protein
MLSINELEKSIEIARAIIADSEKVKDKPGWYVKLISDVKFVLSLSISLRENIINNNRRL